MLEFVCDRQAAANIPFIHLTMIPERCVHGTLSMMQHDATNDQIVKAPRERRLPAYHMVRQPKTGPKGRGLATTRYCAPNESTERKEAITNHAANNKTWDSERQGPWPREELANEKTKQQNLKIV